MSDIVEIYKEHPVLVSSVIAAFIAFCGVCITTITTLINSKRSVYINSVTAQRAAWVEKLRYNIAKFITKMNLLSIKITKGELDEAEFEELNEITCVINLQLNPSNSNSIDYGVSCHMEYFIKNFRDRDKVSSDIDNFIRHSQFLLKEEWEVIKGESKFDIISRFNYWIKKRKRTKEYQKFRREQLAHLKLG